MLGNARIKRIDWLIVGIYLFLVLAGWLNIYAASSPAEPGSAFDWSAVYGKQLVFISISLVMIWLLFLLETRWIERFSSIAYILSLVLLAGLFVAGKTISGATSWYGLGFFNFQPSELAKITAALALAKYLSDVQIDMKRPLTQWSVILIILLPALLVIPQPDPGSALIYFTLIFVLFREGFPLTFLWVGIYGILLFIATLKWGVLWASSGVLFLGTVLFYQAKKRFKWRMPMALLILVLSIAGSFSVNYIYEEVFEQRHRDRFSLWLDLEKDPDVLKKINKTIGYNAYQSEKTIESGGFWGKGFLEGSRTKGNFVPEQHTDYIFSTIGEEWGFVGSFSVILAFSVLLIRLWQRAEAQTNKFNRIYGYGVISILGFHYIINIGMVLGLLPTIGIPLPLISYGGSGMLFFTLLLFLFVKLDSNRLSEWD